MANKISSLLMGVATLAFMGAGFAGGIYVLDQEDPAALFGFGQGGGGVTQLADNADNNEPARQPSPVKTLTQPAVMPEAAKVKSATSEPASSIKIETVTTRQVDASKPKPVVVAAVPASPQASKPVTGGAPVKKTAGMAVPDAPMRRDEILQARRNVQSREKQANAPVVKVAGPPLADSAEIAMINASLTLPESLNIFRVSNRPVYGTDVNSNLLNKAALKPQLFKSGRAFGGFTEAEFRKRELRCMATGIYFEARGEPVRGQQAVAQTIMNRVRSPDYPDTICGVIFQGDHRRTGCQFSFACDGKTDRPSNARQWETAKQVARDITSGKIWLKDIGYSTHYHATYVKPYWIKDMRYVKRIGRHIFYKARNISVTDTFQKVRG